jgi:hypothetical protein
MNPLMNLLTSIVGLAALVYAFPKLISALGNLRDPAKRHRWKRKRDVLRFVAQTITGAVLLGALFVLAVKLGGEAAGRLLAAGVVILMGREASRSARQDH